MKEFKQYCPHCKEEHIVSPTYDTDGNPVGFFCNRVKLMVNVESEKAIWNSEDLTDDIETFATGFIDKQAIRRLDGHRLTALGKRIAYAYLQSDFAKSRRVNFAFAQFYAERCARKIHSAVIAEGGR